MTPLHISRRTLFGTAGLAACASPLLMNSAFAVPDAAAAHAMSFRVMRNGDNIGTHTLAFSGDPAGDLTVTVDVAMAVKLVGISVYRYKHHAVESWKAGQFTTLDAKADNNGDAAWCTVRRDGASLTVEGSAGKRYTAPGSTLAATHWNKDELKGAMINPENGMLISPKITDMGNTDVALASGTKVQAQHFSWRGARSLDLWYQPSGEWAALTATGKDGSLITYERL
ncbi:MAG TPA: DUF6134 family protein [Rhizomicrobium sp.]|nr:DUF6134 family protein [Rhizomicrobium sp.]